MLMTFGRGCSFLIEIGIEYQSMSIHDNVDAKDDGAQIKRFIEAADVIDKILKQVNPFYSTQYLLTYYQS
jgi:hypothetical protein